MKDQGLVTVQNNHLTSTKKKKTTTKVLQRVMWNSSDLTRNESTDVSLRDSPKRNADENTDNKKARICENEMRIMMQKCYVTDTLTTTKRRKEGTEGEGEKKKSLHSRDLKLLNKRTTTTASRTTTTVSWFSCYNSCWLRWWVVLYVGMMIYIDNGHVTTASSLADELLQVSKMKSSLVS